MQANQNEIVLFFPCECNGNLFAAARQKTVCNYNNPVE